MSEEMPYLHCNKIKDQQMIHGLITRLTENTNSHQETIIPPSHQFVQSQDVVVLGQPIEEINLLRTMAFPNHVGCCALDTTIQEKSLKGFDLERTIHR